MKTIFRTKFGAHLYGCVTPASDIDYKSVFIPDASDILLQRAPGSVNNKRPKGEGEKNYVGEIDEEAFSFHKYLRLLAEGQTVALDVLFAPQFAWVEEPDPLWHIVTQNADKFISRSHKSFVGYCRTQANKYGIRGSRVHAVRNIVAWFDAAIEEYGHLAKLGEAADTLQDFITYNNLEHTSILYIPHHTRPEPIPHLECCNRKTPYFNTLKDSRAIYQRVFVEYGHRALQSEKNEGVDWKALSHAVRVGDEALELLRTGRITFPLPNAAHVLDIKVGRLPYAEVAEEIERLLVEVETAAESSSLPEKADSTFIENLICDVYCKAVREWED